MKHAQRSTKILLPAIIAASFTLPGCYTRTVDSRGLGTRYQGGQIHSPNLKSTKSGGGLLDGAGDLLIGPRTIEERQR